MQHFGDCLQYSVSVFNHVVVPEAQGAIAMIAKPLVANYVAFVFGMLSAIDFDDQSLFPANEVHDVRSDGFLPDEFHSAEGSRTKPIPKSLLGKSGVTAKAPRGFCLSNLCAAHEKVPPHAQLVSRRKSRPIN